MCYLDQPMCYLLWVTCLLLSCLRACCTLRAPEHYSNHRPHFSETLVKFYFEDSPVVRFRELEVTTRACLFLIKSKMLLCVLIQHIHWTKRSLYYRLHNIFNGLYFSVLQKYRCKIQPLASKPLTLFWAKHCVQETFWKVALISQK